MQWKVMFNKKQVGWVNGDCYSDALNNAQCRIDVKEA